MIEMFQKLALENKYIELIIAELSLCSDDLEHLNFYGFFERFYIEEGNEDYGIEEEESQESYRPSNMNKAHKKHAYDSEDGGARFLLAPQQPIANKDVNFDDEDMVSDDGKY